MLEYKGYTAHVELDSEAEILHGEVLDTRDVITFQGRSVEEIQRAFRDSVDDYLEFCAKRGEELDKLSRGASWCASPPGCTGPSTLRPRTKGRA
jgi:predicted HicB family RNase H-like nuclease